MGDLFHQTNANQSATNQQIGTSTRDINGQQVIGGAGSVTAGTGLSAQNSSVRITNTSLDPMALNTAAALVHDAVASNNDIAHTAISQFQNSLGASAETPGGQVSISPDQTAGYTTGDGLNPSQLLWIAIAIVGTVLLVGKSKS